MTREVAIEWLKRDVSRLWDTPMNNLHKEALNKAIKALSQEPCEDTISREKVIAIVEKLFMLPLETEEDVEDAFEYFKREIKDLPPIQSKVKAGKWINDEEVSHCSKCNQRIFTCQDWFKFCPNCGAKMEVEK
jgi:NADH pyrophosphatase NudC (nudix superfamily)